MKSIINIMSNSKNLTIGVIDSGIGGVSVLNQIIEKYHTGNFIYFADNLYMPYGNKTDKWLQKRLKTIILTLQNQYHVDYIIIACNTASSCIDDKINNVLTMKFNPSRTYLATRLTKKNLPNLNIIDDVTLAKQIENNILHENKLKKIVSKHVKQYKLYKIKELVLGCTHYELIKPIFEYYLPNCKITNNSLYALEDFPDDIINSSELNIKVLLSQQNNALEQKINKLINF